MQESAVVTTTQTEEIKIAPQPGSQERFLRSTADIAVYGGAAGAGKTYALLLEPIYHMNVEGFGAVIFRTTFPQIKSEGGLWDTSCKIYKLLNAEPKESALEWKFPDGQRIRFAHMQHDDDRHNWDGSQIPLICFDQLEHFSKKQFFYMLSRNRSTCGVKPYIRATCNPDPDHWLRSFMSWWIDEATGLPIDSRSGVKRYFTIQNNQVIWADTRAEIKKEYGDEIRALSFTFIPGRVYDNKILLKEDPSYLGNLNNMHQVDKERLLSGNWNIREQAGTIFKREWFGIVDAAPGGGEKIRYWDRAGTVRDPKTNGKHSATAGIRMTKSNGIYYVDDVSRFYAEPHTVEEQIKNVATQDGIAVRIGIEQDPGQAGKAEALSQIRNLAGYTAHVNVVREAKGVRAKPFGAQAGAGNVKLVRGAWNEKYLQELENFDGTKDCVSDQVDASSGAFFMLNQTKRAGAWGRR